MNPQQLSAFFAAHKAAVLGGGAAAVAALGLYQRKKNKTGAAATTAGATIPGTIPAAAVVGTGNSTATYDSTAFDIYDALQQQISDLASQQQTSSPTTAAAATPAPLASTLFAPTYSGNYAKSADGQLLEIESDGSLLHMNNKALATLGPSVAYSQLAANPSYFSITDNLNAVQAGGGPLIDKYTGPGVYTPTAWSQPKPANPTATPTH